MADINLSVNNQVPVIAKVYPAGSGSGGSATTTTFSVISEATANLAPGSYIIDATAGSFAITLAAGSGTWEFSDSKMTTTDNPVTIGTPLQTFTTASGTQGEGPYVISYDGTHLKVANVGTPDEFLIVHEPNNIDASEVVYDNTTSGLSATNVQSAIDEINTGGGDGISDIVEDTSPQLGGNLDTNGNGIRFRGLGHANYVALQASIVEPLSSVTFYLPTADGSNGQVLSTNGSGRLSWSDNSGGGLADVVDDTTPQLGGDLDTNGNSITSSGANNLVLSPLGTGVVQATSALSLAAYAGGAITGTTEAFIAHTSGGDVISVDPEALDVHLIPATDSLKNLGSGTLRWATVYTDLVDAGLLTTSITNGDIQVLPDGTGSVILSNDIQLSSYGSGTFTGTAAKWLAVDASGNVIEEDAPTGGGGDAANANFIVAVSDEITYLSTGTAKVTFPWPYTGKTITRVRASVTSAPTDTASGTLDIDINDDGVSILSSVLSIAAGATSDTETSFATSSPAKDSVMTVDIDEVTDTLTGKGLKIQFDFD